MSRKLQREKVDMGRGRDDTAQLVQGMMGTQWC